MDCDIISAKIIHFITPALITDKRAAFVNRWSIWQLLKTNFSTEDKLIIAQFERHPSLHYLRVAITDLLAFQLKKDPELKYELEHYLNTYYDIETIARRGNWVSDLLERARSISYQQVSRPWQKVREFLTI